jgi:hypothetical protein
MFESDARAFSNDSHEHLVQRLGLLAERHVRSECAQRLNDARREGRRS